MLPELSHKLLLFPSISFPAFQPDQCYVRIKGTFSEVSGPLGPYHSSIAYYAWRAGMSVQQATDLFCDEVYQQLRFYDYWDSATQALLEEGARGLGQSTGPEIRRDRACLRKIEQDAQLLIEIGKTGT